MVLTSHNIWMLILRALSALAGLGSFYLALFMYKDDADRWQNRLVDLWVEIRSGSQGFLSAQAALVKKSSGFVTSWLTWLFGERLVSIRVIAISFSLSFASSMFIFSCLSVIDLVRESAWNPQHSPLEWVIFASFGVAFFLLGSFAVRGFCPRDRPLLALMVPLTLAALASTLLFYLYGWQDRNEPAISDSARTVEILLTASILCILCDLLVLIANRLVLQSMASTVKVAVLAWGFLYNLAWTAFLVDSAIYVLRGEPSASVSWPGDPIGAILTLPFFQSERVVGLTTLILVALTSNLFTLWASACVLAIVTAALAHRLFWPAAERSVYALYQWNFFTNKPFQISAGLALLLFAFPGLRAVLELFKP